MGDDGRVDLATLLGCLSQVEGRLTHELRGRAHGPQVVHAVADELAGDEGEFGENLSKSRANSCFKFLWNANARSLCIEKEEKRNVIVNESAPDPFSYHLAQSGGLL